MVGRALSAQHSGLLHLLKSNYSAGGLAPFGVPEGFALGKCRGRQWRANCHLCMSVSGGVSAHSVGLVSVSRGADTVREAPAFQGFRGLLFPESIHLGAQNWLHSPQPCSLHPGLWETPPLIPKDALCSARPAPASGPPVPGRSSRVQKPSIH